MNTRNVLNSETFDLVLTSELKRAQRSQNFVTLVRMEPRSADSADSVREIARLVSPELRETDLLATDATAAETLGDHEPNLGSFTIKRSEPLDAPLTGKYSIGGTASNGADYTEIATSATIPGGAASIVIPIAPKNDAAIEGTESVVLRLTPTDGYVISGEQAAATRGVGKRQP